MGISKSLGGDRLGSGNKMKVSMHGYGRSTHNLSRAWRSSMAPGTLVPCFVEPILTGDTWDIDVNTLIRTLPTNGPLFGRFKIQVDFFKADIRLYNRMLHNNLSKVGLDMAKVKLPLIEVEGYSPIKTMYENEDPNQVNVSTDSLLSYLGIRGLGTKADSPYYGTIKRQFNAIPMLAYWEIYQNYYANKQEERGFVISSELTKSEQATLTTGWYFGNGGLNPGKESIHTQKNLIIKVTIGDELSFSGTNLDLTNIEINGKIKNSGATDYRTLDSLSVETLEKTDTFIKVKVKSSTKIDTIDCNGVDGGARVNGVLIVQPTGLKLQPFPLTNIEELRDKVFEQPNTAPLIVTKTAKLPYAASLAVWKKDAKETGNRSTSAWTMAGLGIKTYNSDRFNNWLKKEWIDATNGINAVSSVPIVDGKFTIDSLNLMQKVYNLLNRIALSGGTYQDWLETTTGMNLSYSPEIPIFVGGMNGTIEFNEVISTAETPGIEAQDGSPLGTLAGRGYEQNQSRGKIIIKAKEHGYIIGIVSITPELDYSQGNVWHCNLKNMDQFHKPELSQIGYQELLTDEMAAFSTDVINNVPVFKSAGKQTAWIHYQTSINQTFGKFAQFNSEMFMTLNRNYEYKVDASGAPTSPGLPITDLTTYIDPSKFNYAFAQTDLSAQNFWVQIGFKAIARRIMSAKSIPNI